MVYGGGGYRMLGHFFQANGLSGHLYIVVEPLFALAVFVFYGIDFSVRVKLHNVTESRQPKSLRPDW